MVWHPIPEPCFQKGMLSEIFFINGFKNMMYKRLNHEDLYELVYNVLQGGILGDPRVIMDVLLNFDLLKTIEDANERRR